MAALYICGALGAVLAEYRRAEPDPLSAHPIGSSSGWNKPLISLPWWLLAGIERGGSAGWTAAILR
jgi:hypothetical protein